MHVATAAAQWRSWYNSRCSKAHQHESEKVEQPVAEFSQKPMVISTDGRKRLASFPIVQPACSLSKNSRLGSFSSAKADRSRLLEANNAADYAASNDGSSIVAVWEQGEKNTMRIPSSIPTTSQ